MLLDRLCEEDRSLVEKELEAAVNDKAGFGFDFRALFPGGLTRYLHGVGPQLFEGREASH
jgi:hypothetical protein